MLVVQPRPYGARPLADFAHRLVQLLRRAAEFTGPEGDFPILGEADVPVILRVELPGLRRLDLRSRLLASAARRAAGRWEGVGLVVEAGHGGKSSSSLWRRSSPNENFFSSGERQDVKSENSYRQVE